MSQQQALANTWRPRRFEDFVGQTHVVKALVNSLTEERLHHAYLFTGTRGVGKTTLARILAKCLNCEQGISAAPCESCDSCIAITTGKFIDLLEIDAASRTKVEDIRELLDNVQYAPNQGRFKIYLIDEVHMLSGHSFNALLKTLEEPPPYVKFLLATTDPQKLPPTVLSRCLQFHLKCLPVQAIHDRMAEICNAEKINADALALTALAQAANGSLRDGLSLLEQAIAFGGGELSTVGVSELLGTVAPEHVCAIVDALIASDGTALLNTCDSLAELGADVEQVTAQLLSAMHDIALKQAVADYQPPNSLLSAEQLQHYSQHLHAETLQLYYQMLLQGQQDIPLAPTPQSGFAMLLVRLLAYQPITHSLQEIFADVCDPKAVAAPASVAPPAASKVSAPTPSAAQPKTAPEAEPTAAVEQTTTVPTPSLDTTAPQPQPPAEPSPPPATETTAPAQAAPLAQDTQTPQPQKPTASTIQDTQQWSTLITQLPITGMGRALLNHCAFVSHTGNTITLKLQKNHSSMLNPKQQERIKQVLGEHFSQPIQLDIIVESDVADTPAHQAETEQNARQAAAQDALEKDPQIQQLKQQFDAELVPGSIDAVSCGKIN